MARTEALVNPVLLRWARETAGYTLVLSEPPAEAAPPPDYRGRAGADPRVVAPGLRWHVRRLRNLRQAALDLAEDEPDSFPPFPKSDADAWVIGLARECHAIIVTQEKPKPGARVPFKIPDVARAVGATSIGLDEFINTLQGLPAFVSMGSRNQ